MSRSIKILFFASGNGGTLRFICESIKHLHLPWEVVGVISDRICGATEYASNCSIKVECFSPWTKNTEQINQSVRSFSPDIIISAFDRIIADSTLESLTCPCVNLHYSLLPAYKGVTGFKTLEMARGNNAKIIGATVHHVSPDLDGGKIIAQGAMGVDWEDDLSTIGNNLFRIACLTLLNGVNCLLQNPCQYYTCPGVIWSPNLTFDPQIFTEDFWNSIKS